MGLFSSPSMMCILENPRKTMNATKRRMFQQPHHMHCGSPRKICVGAETDFKKIVGAGLGFIRHIKRKISISAKTDLRNWRGWPRLYHTYKRHTTCDFSAARTDFKKIAGVALGFFRHLNAIKRGTFQQPQHVHFGKPQENKFFCKARF